MPRSVSRKSTNKSPRSSVSSSNKHQPLGKRILSMPLDAIRWVGRVVVVPVRKLRNLRERRTHKSFARSRRRDYVRPLGVPGYFAFTIEVGSLLLRNRKLFVLLSIVTTLLILILSGLSSHQLYSSITESVGTDSEGVPMSLQVGTLVLSTAGLMASGTSEAQQVYIAAIGLITWLASVWLLREILAGQKPRLRDGLYNAGSPIISTVIVALLLLLQFIPVGLLALVYIALSTTGLISEGLGAFLFFGAAALVVTLTLYWITATLFAMVIITLPGMYPWQAMRAASDIVVGRRLRMLYRVIWMIIQIISTWVIVMAPVVLLDIWLNDLFGWFKYVPLVPVMSTWLAMALVIWASSYVYLLYRKVVASDAQSSS